MKTLWSSGASAGSRSTSAAPASAWIDRRLSGCDIFSEPTTATVSYTPASIAMHARCSAVEPLAHAFSTFTVGIPP